MSGEGIAVGISTASSRCELTAYVTLRVSSRKRKGVAEIATSGEACECCLAIPDIDGDKVGNDVRILPPRWSQTHCPQECISLGKCPETEPGQMTNKVRSAYAY